MPILHLEIEVRQPARASQVSLQVGIKSTERSPKTKPGRKQASKAFSETILLNFQEYQARKVSDSKGKITSFSQNFGSKTKTLKTKPGAVFSSRTLETLRCLRIRGHLVFSRIRGLKMPGISSTSSSKTDRGRNSFPPKVAKLNGSSMMFLKFLLWRLGSGSTGKPMSN